MTFQGLREAFARGDRCTQPIGEARQCLAGVFAERLERRFECQSGADQKCQLAQKNGNIARSRWLFGAPATAGQNSRCRDLSINRQVSQILDAPNHLLTRRSLDLADDDFACVGDSSISELWHWTGACRGYVDDIQKPSAPDVVRMQYYSKSTSRRRYVLIDCDNACGPR